ncbi:uncharacterized protein LOC114802510 [Denticeps clupeoides]|uniref:uncharacterized protein LOC114802510 n=1 Tax=Denticeps clupeoides TaxID=299321 RepID=UPI0010A4350D|nr:uncharacterized protein LOC114802510 [Denticeps clupeoides]
MSDPDEFQRVLHGVGGKERVFLVSDHDRGSTIQEFLQDLFAPDHELRGGETRCDDDGRPDPSPAVAGVTAPDPAEGAVKSASRAVDAAVVMFLINQQYVQRTPNRVCVKEILKDVKARIRHLKVRPALVGLVRSEVETGQSQALVEVLERLLRSVFRQHSHQAIWAGVFIPGNVERILAVRRHATMALISSLAQDPSDRNARSCWPLRQVSWWTHGRRRPTRGQHDSELTSHCGTETVEEGIPLKTRPAVVANGQKHHDS